MSAAKLADMNRRLIASTRKPKRKFASREQRHHYAEASKHYHAYRVATKAGHFKRADKHIQAFHKHAKAGKLTEFHRDQLQHDAKHFGMPKSARFTPFKPKLRLVVKSMSRKKLIERHMMFQRQMNAGMKSGQRVREAEAAGKTAQAKKHRRRVKWHALRAKKHAAKLGLKLRSGVKK